ncbi:tRNA glutamyl-Q(34) synthetase GluQRS [Kushneria indalinina]|uniref:Glutamyl-Q tRNA(Asp) synthetase n=1 Tax=Kushneria indalinina DSM 14324 TaxID=1122140 RepID=A0A3D9DS18_9GAMM|nr:tRNA glutamyl-Q(34) synthetase GluQRS [Kushneria indalinina]REC93471.1 glutamyl-Q tRNA(Asp) synthetase [Kushneria indalinina DSM 14324]
MPGTRHVENGPAVVGRFAPTPSGPLHFGSLLTALASWLDVRARGGRWLLRMEDIDPPRCPPGASDTILEQLDAFGLYHDGAVDYQQDHDSDYQQALDTLVERGMAYPCSCSRKEWQHLGVYPGWCRQGPLHPERDCAWRLRTDIGEPAIHWQDRRLGQQHWSLPELGDVVLKRRDGLWAYQLAVVVDDARQGVTDIVRGVDLLDNTPWQIRLQQALGYTTPEYLHLPLVIAGNGQKLSKQNLAPALSLQDHAVRPLLHEALTLLGQSPSQTLCHAPVGEQLKAAIDGWQPHVLSSHNVQQTTSK